MLTEEQRAEPGRTRRAADALRTEIDDDLRRRGTAGETPGQVAADQAHADRMRMTRKKRVPSVRNQVSEEIEDATLTG